MAGASNDRLDSRSTRRHPNLLTEARMHRTDECYFKHTVSSRFEAIVTLRVVGVGWVFIEKLLGARFLITTKTRISSTYSNLNCPRQISCNRVSIVAKNPRLS